MCGALQIRSWGSRGLQDCFFRSSRGARGLRNMRVSVVPRKLLLLIGKDTLKVFEARLGLENNIGCFPGAGDFQGKNVVRQSSWALDGTLVARFVLGGFMIRSRHERQRHHRFSAHVTNEAFSVR